MKLVFATTNRGKLAELRALVEGLEIEIVGLEETGLRGAIVEDAPTFAGNARKKAEEVARRTGWPTLADDSGLEVDALGGAPGIYSARYGEPPASHSGANVDDQIPVEPRSDARNNERLLAALTDLADPGKSSLGEGSRHAARFRCALALARPGHPTVVEEGVCEGEILTVPRGAGGFGYDPLFFLPLLQRTMSELTLEEKNQVSHRAQAMARMRPHLTALATGLQPPRA